MRKAAEDAVLQQIAKRSSELGLDGPAISQFNTAAMAANQGDQASIFVDLNRGTGTTVNDGDPNAYVRRGNGMVNVGPGRHSWPHPNQGQGFSYTTPLTNRDMHNFHQYMDRMGY